MYNGVTVKIFMSGENMFEATSVILATGVQYGKPIKGEEEYLGRGLIIHA